MGKGYTHLIDPHLYWNYHTKMIAPKLSRAVGMLAKIRHFVSTENLCIIYFGMFSSLLNYGAQIWSQCHNCHRKRVTKLQDKAIRIINFAHFRESTSKLYKKSKILKFKGSITLNNYLYVHDSLKCSLPHVFMLCMIIILVRQLYNVYGIHSVKGQFARAWNHLQLTCPFDNMHLCTRNVCKKVISQFSLITTNKLLTTVIILLFTNYNIYQICWKTFYHHSNVNGYPSWHGY